jgi:dephospho-CoA kinase
MGKSTVAGMFAKSGVPVRQQHKCTVVKVLLTGPVITPLPEGTLRQVQDADKIVHQLYAKGGAAVGPIAEMFGADVVVDGSIDRRRLSSHVLGNSEALQRLEALVHPLVRAERGAFVEQAAQQGMETTLSVLCMCQAHYLSLVVTATLMCVAPAGHHLVVLDIPLLYETGIQSELSAVAVVSAPYEVQRARVLSRPGWDEPKFQVGSSP